MQNRLHEKHCGMVRFVHSKVAWYMTGSQRSHSRCIWTCRTTQCGSLSTRRRPSVSILFALFEIPSSRLPPPLVTVCPRLARHAPCKAYSSTQASNQAPNPSITRHAAVARIPVEQCSEPNGWSCFNVMYPPEPTFQCFRNRCSLRGVGGGIVQVGPVLDPYYRVFQEIGHSLERIQKGEVEDQFGLMGTCSRHPPIAHLHPLNAYSGSYSTQQSAFPARSHSMPMLHPLARLHAVAQGADHPLSKLQANQNGDGAAEWGHE